jgi:PPOX class probable FMN-dependent enzyme
VDVVTSVEQLEALYAAPVETSLLKVTDHITPLQQRYVDESPFVILATVGAEGVDCSPRGDPAGFVRVVDRRTVQIPDRRGNNRLDSLRNIVRDGRVALLFVIPGIGVTLRINGTAVLRTDADVRASFEIDGKQPATVIEVAVTECYTQCPKALIRPLERRALPQRHRSAHRGRDQLRDQQRRLRRCRLRRRLPRTRQADDLLIGLASATADGGAGSPLSV